MCGGTYARHDVCPLRDEDAAMRQSPVLRRLILNRPVSAQHPAYFAGFSGAFFGDAGFEFSSTSMYTFSAVFWKSL